MVYRKAAACEPCRKSKLGCDHLLPVCTRCRRTDKTTSCIYRDAPFERHRRERPRREADRPLIPSTSRSTSQTPEISNRGTYPNPGYLGSSSHVEIFNQVPKDTQHAPNSRFTNHTPVPHATARQLSDDNLLVRQAGQNWEKLVTAFPLNLQRDLLSFWLAKGVNLALAGPFVRICAASVESTRLLVPTDPPWHVTYVESLLQNTGRKLSISNVTTTEDFEAQFTGLKARLETLGLFLSAVTRASLDISFFPPLYTTAEEQIRLGRLSMALADVCLEICLSFDCLNDLQLMLQYESFIVHSLIDGDQSFQSWRKLGDVITSILALGYHEQIDSTCNAPLFLVELRKTAFARVYSADKNVALFLGRAPRLSKRFCQFHIPMGEFLTVSTFGSDKLYQWSAETEINYRVETCWSAICASLKEEILEMLHQDHDVERVDRVNSIQCRAEAQWHSLPPHFRQGTDLNECSTSPLTRDFLLSTRLNHLHVLFLLRLLLLPRITEPDVSLVHISQELLKRVVEVILCRELLANSGTGLVWKVAHYGLPAAGILLLALIKQPENLNMTSQSQARILQDLTVLSAEIQRGTIVKPGDANYGYFLTATRTIQGVIDKVFLNTNKQISSSAGQVAVADSALTNDFETPWLATEPWRFEMGFWQGLEEYSPMLSYLDPVT